MSELDSPIQSIEQKLKEVLKRYAALRKENLRLQTEAAKLSETIVTKEEELKHLRRQTDILKSGIKGWHPEQKKLFVKRIDTYLKEIDNCIALLNE